MKNKRILLIAVLLIAVLSFGVFALTACRDGKGTGDVTVVIACDGSNKVYRVDADEVDGEGLLPILLYLKDKKGLNLKYENGAYGLYLTEVGNFVDGTDNEYICIYTSVVKDYDVSGYKSTVEYDSVTLVSSGVGVSEMSVEENAIILIGKITFGE